MASLESHGVTTTKRFVARSVRDDRIPALLGALESADLLVLSTPLYVDALPYLVTRAMERIDAHRARQEIPRPVRFAAIVNCGFPEAHTCDTALGLCRSFARHAEMAWAGGLALGAGAVIDGRLLESMGRVTRHVRAALDATAEALAHGQDVPERAVEWMAHPLIPTRAYTMMTHLHWVREARRNGVLKKLGDRPFA
jgi:hypothetical protein